MSRDILDINDIDLEILDIGKIRVASQKMEVDLDAEIEHLQKAVLIDGVDQSGKTADSEEELMSFIQRSFGRLKKAGLAAQELEHPGNRKSPEEVRNLLSDLVRQQDRFLVEMKVAQLRMVQLMIGHYDAIEGVTDATTILDHNAALTRSLEMLKEMPSLEEFESTSLRIGKLVGMYAVTSAISRAIGEVDSVLNTGAAADNTATRVLAAGASQAFRENANSFLGFIAGTNAVTTPVVESKLEEIVQESAFTYGITKSFEEGFIISEAVRDGKVKGAEDATDRLLGVSAKLVSQIPIPTISQAASAAVSIASFVYSSQKSAATRNRADFAEGDLRGEIIEGIASKMYEHYSKDSYLDSFSKKGQVRFADMVVEKMMSRIGSFQVPSEKEIESAGLRVDDAKLNPGSADFDPKYCEELSAKWGVEIDQEKLKRETYRNNIATTLETKMYVDFVTDKLIEPVIQGRDRISLSGFKQDDFAKPANYLEEKTNEAIASLTNSPISPFKTNPEEGIAAAIDALIKDYLGKKEQNPQLTHEDFLKNSQINSGGKSYFGLTGRVRDEARENFNSNLKSPLLALLEAVDHERSDAEIGKKLQKSTSSRSFDGGRDDSGNSEINLSNSGRTIDRVIKMAGEHIDNFSQESRAIQNSNREKIEREQKDLEAKLEKAEGSLKWRPFKKALTALSFGLYSGGSKKVIEKEDKNIEDLNAAIAKCDERLISLDKQADVIDNLAPTFQVEAQVTLEGRKGVSLSGLVKDATAVVESIDIDQSIADVSKNTAQKQVLNAQAARSLKREGVVADAIIKGKVDAQDDAVDLGIQAVGMVADQVPIASVAINVALVGAQYLNDQKKGKTNQSVADFALSKEGREAVEYISSKVHDYYSVKVDGASSALDALTEKGQKKFIDHVVMGVIAQAAKDSSKAPDVDALIGSVIKGQSKEIFGKSSFTEEDLSADKKGEKMTLQGLVGRVGIITPDGRRYLSQDRKESAIGESKYGYRMATPQELEDIANGKPLAGYKEFVGKDKAVVVMGNQVETANIGKARVDVAATDPYEKIRNSTERGSEELEDLKAFQVSKRREYVAANVRSEKTDILSASVSAFAVPVGSLFGSKKTLQETEAQTTADKEIAKCDEGKKGLASLMRDDHLKPQFKQEGIVSAVDGFIEGYHARVMDGASKDELVKFAQENMPVTNSQLAKKLVDLAVDYSEAKISKAAENRGGIHLSGKDSDELHKIEDILKSANLHSVSVREATTLRNIVALNTEGRGGGGRGGSAAAA